MKKYVLKRLLLFIPVLLGVSFIVFSIISLTPGDPGTIILGQNATKESIDQLNHELGYDQPFLVRFFHYIIHAVQGDFGESYRTGKPVFNEIFARFPTTFKLATGAVIVAIAIGIPIGIISAVRQYSVLDTIGTITAMFMASVPQFWLGLMMILAFAVTLGWLPSTGISSWKHFIMPIITLALPCAANVLRMTRSTMLETIRQDYIRTARAKGAPESTVVLKHALRNALLPVITVVGINFGYLLGGTVLIESVFGIPGVGTLTITSIRMKDIPQTAASVLFLAFIYCAMMLAVDILYAYIDPRIKARYAK